MIDLQVKRDAPEAALTELLRAVSEAGYEFISPTPSTHRLVAERRLDARSGNLRDIFGWGRRFVQTDVGASILDQMQTADLLEAEEGRLRSRVRLSTLDGRLHLHSARSDARDSVFLGPDSYRFVRFLHHLEGLDDVGSVLDIGTGAGAGALAMAARLPQARVVASDINPLALRYLAANAAHARLSIDARKGPGLEAAEGQFDLIIANPPYIVDSEQRTYRHGGGALGTELACDWVQAGLSRLNPGGRFALYTGSPVVDGVDPLKRELQRMAHEQGATLSYEELDPDVFGGTLRQPAYAEVERIAAIGAVLRI